LPTVDRVAIDVSKMGLENVPERIIQAGGKKIILPISNNLLKSGLLVELCFFL